MNVNQHGALVYTLTGHFIRERLELLHIHAVVQSANRVAAARNAYNHADKGGSGRVPIQHRKGENLGDLRDLLVPNGSSETAEFMCKSL